MPSPRTPADWPREFTDHLNVGELDSVMALYEPQASLVQRSGETLIGRDKIRPVLAELVRTKTRLDYRVVRVITVDDVAVLYTDFQGTTLDAAGEPLAIVNHAVEVLRRQSDGSWKLIVGDPNGRA